MEIESGVNGLESVLHGYTGKKMLVLCRGDPDPDWLGAAKALELFTKPMNIELDFVSTAPVGCAQNQEEIVWLDMKVKMYTPVMSMKSYSSFGVLDAHGIERRLVKDLNGLPWAFLIDHHDPNLNGMQPQFMDIRRDVGSTCTIISSYIEEKGLLQSSNRIHRVTASALMYGIRVDTNSLKRAKPLDYHVLEYLSHFGDKDALNRLFYQRMTQQDMDLQVKAWKGKVVEGAFVISGVGEIKPKNKVAMAFAADKFIEVYGYNTALIYGIVGCTLQGSLRTCDPEIRPKLFLESMFPQIYEWGGDCGGHETGGFAIPLEKVVEESSNKASQWERVRTFVTYQFFQALGKPVPIQSPLSGPKPRQTRRKEPHTALLSPSHNHSH